MPDAAPLRSGHLHADGLCRCHWPGQDPLYIAYHDEEWGVPERDGRALFQKLLLDGFQAGLSWITILRKRPAFRQAFAGFDPGRMAGFTPGDVERLMGDAGIVRNRSKIEAAIQSARAMLRLEEQRGFAAFLWDFVDGEPIQNSWRLQGEVPVETDLSRRMAKALKAEGFRFCGPTITYAFMEAVGLVNDHLVACWRHQACRELARRELACRELAR